MSKGAKQWKVELLKPLPDVPYGAEGMEWRTIAGKRTVEDGKYTMHEYGQGYRLRAHERGFFDRTRFQIDALIESGALRIVDGDWPP